MLKKDKVVQMNNIGQAIQYFRETYQISQSTLSKGLCSVPTLSRIEAGERDVDPLLLETLLERLGKEVNQFELILTDSDYRAYQNREAIKKNIEVKEFAKANELLKKYEAFAASKGSVHKQFEVANWALLNESIGGDENYTIELLMEAIEYTVPDFKTNNIMDYYLSKSEINIIIDIIQHMLGISKVEQSKAIVHELLNYLELHYKPEDGNKLYTKVAMIAARIYIKESDWMKVLELCNLGIEKNKGNRKIEYYGELYLMKAQSQEAIYKNQSDWENCRRDCLRLYVLAYYCYKLNGEIDIANKIIIYIREEYQWEGID